MAKKKNGFVEYVRKHTAQSLVFLLIFLICVSCFAFLICSNASKNNETARLNPVDDTQFSFSTRTDEELEALANELFAVESIPKIYLTANGEITQKEYAPLLSMTMTDDVFPENNYSNLTGEIKARGNTSRDAGLEYGPMPYKIKLSESENFFGIGESKKWVLLSTFLDRSYVRQIIGFNVGRMIMGSQYFSPAAKYVEVFFNGEYRGLYLMAESIEEDAGRLNIKTKIASDNLEIPFLLELDMALPDHELCYSVTTGSAWFSINETVNVKPDRCNRVTFAIKYPDGFEGITEDQRLRLIGTMNELYENTKNKAELATLNIDMQSFVEFFLFQEIFDNNGFAHSSTYLYRPEGGKITMGPLWDFDMNMTVVDSIGFNAPELYDNVLFRYLMGYEEFSDAMKKRFLEVYEKVMPLVKSQLIAFKNNNVLKSAVLRDQAIHKTWGVKLEGLRAYQNDNIVALTSFDAHIDYILGWMWDGLTVKQWWHDNSEVTYPGRLEWLKDNLDEWEFAAG